MQGLGDPEGEKKQESAQIFSRKGETPDPWFHPSVRRMDVAKETGLLRIWIS
jgi:hypothetical protein